MCHSSALSPCFVLFLLLPDLFSAAHTNIHTHLPVLCHTHSLPAAVTHSLSSQPHTPVSCCNWSLRYIVSHFTNTLCQTVCCTILPHLSCCIPCVCSCVFLGWGRYLFWTLYSFRPGFFTPPFFPALTLSKLVFLC